MPSPVRGQSGDRPITQIPAALMDMLAATLRGGVKTTMGMPGDLEQLGRMGINAMGGNVDKYPVLPTSEFFDKFLPSDGGRMPTAEKLGEFAPLPMTLGAVPAAKQATSFAKALRGVEAPVDMGRRGALQTIGKAGAGAAAATVAPHMVAEALRAAPEVGTVVKSVAPTVAKAATKWGADALWDAVPNMRILAGGAENAAKNIHPNTLALAQKLFASPDELKNVDGWLKYWEEPGGIEKFKSDFDVRKAHENWYDDMIKAGADDMSLPLRNSSTPGITYSMDPAYSKVAKELEARHFPDSAINPAYKQEQSNFRTLADMPKEEILNILRNSPPGHVPSELAAKGVKPKDLTYRIAPIRGPGGYGNYSPVEKLLEELGYDLGMYERKPLSNEFKGK